jgi:hypothetical protein
VTDSRLLAAVKSIAGSLKKMEPRPQESDEEKFARYLAWIEVKTGDPIKGRSFARFAGPLSKVAKVVKGVGKVR